MRAVVTGASGFLGRHLCAHLVAAGWVVLPEEALTQDDGEPVDCLFHLRAWANAAGCEADPDRACVENVAESLRVGRLARRRGVLAAVYASTTAVYRTETRRRVVADLTPLGPVSAYATTKLAGEHALEAGFRQGATVVRLPNLYGPGQRAGARGAVARWFAALSAGRPIEVYADAASAPRDYVHVRDAAAALARSVEEWVPGSRGIAATGRSWSGLALADAVASVWASLTGDRRARVVVLGECDPVPAPLHALGYDCEVPLAGVRCPTPLWEGLLETARSLLSSRRGTEEGREAVEPERDGECPECGGTGRDGGSSAPCPACLAAADARIAASYRRPADPDAT